MSDTWPGGPRAIDGTGRVPRDRPCASSGRVDEGRSLTGIEVVPIRDQVVGGPGGLAAGCAWARQAGHALARPL